MDKGKSFGVSLAYANSTLVALARALRNSKLKSLAAELAANHETERWRTDPLELMPFFSIPKRFLSRFLTELGDIFHWLAEAIGD